MTRVLDVTEKLIDDASHGPGQDVKRVAQTKGAKKLSPTLSKFFETWKQPSDKTAGYISKALAYGRNINRSPSQHANMIRLIKGGHIRVCEVAAPPPRDSRAHTESPYGDRFYTLRADSCPTEIEPTAATFGRGQKKRRR